MVDSPPVTPPGPPKQFDRDQALERALETFWEHGYRGTSMRHLLDSMQIGRQSLYDTFGGKHELFVESLTRYMDRMMEPMLELLDQPRPAMECLGAMFDTWLQMADEGACKGCLAVMSTSELAGEDAKVSQLLEARFLRMEDALRRTLRRAQQEGDLSADIDPLDTARLIMATSKGLAILDRMHPAPEAVAGVVDALRLLLHRP